MQVLERNPSATSNVIVAGSNENGQIGLGDGEGNTEAIQFRHISQPASFISEPMRLIECGDTHTIFVSVNNRVFVCGINDYGQLGLGADDPLVNIPRELTEPKEMLSSEIVDVVCIGDQTLFLTETGSVYGTGMNSGGQLGLAHTNHVKLPTKMQINTPVKRIRCGFNHTIIYTQNDVLYACGENSCGQLALGHLADVHTPTPITQPHEMTSKQISIEACGGYHTVFVTIDQEIYCCGANDRGQLGLGNLAHQSTPQRLIDPCLIGKRIDTVSCGQEHTIFVVSPMDIPSALGAPSQVFVVGGNYYGQLSLKDYTDRVSLQELVLPFTYPMERLSMVSSGACFVFYISNKNRVYASGSNTNKQLGMTSASKINTLQAVPLVDQLGANQRIRSVKCGTFHSVMCIEDVDMEVVNDFANLVEFSTDLFDTHMIAFDNDNKVDFYVCSAMIRIRCPALMNACTSEENTVTIQGLSASAVELIHNYCVRDTISLLKQENPSWFTILLESFLFITRTNEQSQSTDRFKIMLLVKLVEMVNHDNIVTAINMLEQDRGDQDEETTWRQMDPIRKQFFEHLLAFLYRSITTNRFEMICNYASLPQKQCIRVMTQGHHFKILDKYDKSLKVPNSTLVENMMQLFRETQNDHALGDVTLCLDKTHKVRAHKAILAGRSEYFKKKFLWTENEKNCDEILLYDEEEIENNESKRMMEELNQNGNVIQESVETEVEILYQFIQYLYTGVIQVNNSNAIALLNLWNFYLLPLNSQVCVQAQDIIIAGLNEENVLQFMNVFIRNRSTPFLALEEACIKACVKFWKRIHLRYDNKTIMNWLTQDEYMEITRRYLV